jgi:hypothetical protein
MSDNKLIFGNDSCSRYRITALTGISDQKLPDLPIDFLPGKLVPGSQIRQ